MLSIKLCDQSFGSCLDSGCSFLSAQAVASYDSDFTRLFHIISFLGKQSTHLENQHFVDALWRFLGSLTLSWVSLLSPHSHCHQCSLLSDLFGQMRSIGCSWNSNYNHTIKALTIFLCCRTICIFGKKNKAGFPMLAWSIKTCIWKKIQQMGCN